MYIVINTTSPVNPIFSSVISSILIPTVITLEAISHLCFRQARRLNPSYLYFIRSAFRAFDLVHMSPKTADLSLQSHLSLNRELVAVEVAHYSLAVVVVVRFVVVHIGLG